MWIFLSIFGGNVCVLGGQGEVMASAAGGARRIKKQNNSFSVRTISSASPIGLGSESCGGEKICELLNISIIIDL